MTLTLLEQRRLRARGFNRSDVERAERFGRDVAALYGYVGLPGGVVCPDGQGTLLQALSTGCQVLLTRGRKTGRRKGGEAFKPMREYPVADLAPYAKVTR